MIRKPKIIGYIGLIFTILFYATILLLPTEVEAKAKKMTKVDASEVISYNVNFSLADNLKSLVGKKISVTLDSGTTFTGIVKEVGTHLVHLEKLTGKEYFDALLRIEKISAIDTKVRNIKR
jgi:hypothetical protein